MALKVIMVGHLDGDELPKDTPLIVLSGTFDDLKEIAALFGEEVVVSKAVKSTT